MNRSFLTPQVFTILAGLVEEKLGMRYVASELDLFTSKIIDPFEASGFETAMEYYYALRYDDADGALFEKLAEALLVGETYFFRESGPLAGALDAVIAPAVAKGGRARILSAACSTGEEPLTTALMLEARNLLDATDIVAVDVSHSALQKAKRGVFGARSFRSMPVWAEASFHDENGKRAIRSSILQRVSFRRLNLLHREALSLLGKFDLVICRNVLIYFRDDNVVRVVKSLADSLTPDGRLLVGASESLLRFGTLLHCEERAGTFLYTREPH